MMRWKKIFNQTNDMKLSLCTTIKSLVIISLVALDWAALHDILKANEPDYFLEYFTLIMSIVIVGLLGIHSYFDAKAKKKGAKTGVCM